MKEQELVPNNGFIEQLQTKKFVPTVPTSFVT